MSDTDKVIQGLFQEVCYWVRNIPVLSKKRGTFSVKLDVPLCHFLDLFIRNLSIFLGVIKSQVLLNIKTTSTSSHLSASSIDANSTPTVLNDNFLMETGISIWEKPFISVLPTLAVSLITIDTNGKVSKLSSITLPLIVLF